MYRLIAFRNMKRIVISFVVMAAIAVSAVIVTSCGNANAQGGGSAKSDRWEYKIVYIDMGSDSTAEQNLNVLGKDGWEYAGAHNYNTSSMIFKRRLP